MFFLGSFCRLLKLRFRWLSNQTVMVLLLHEQYLYISWTWKIVILQKERQDERKLKAISLLNIIIKIKFHPWNKPKLALRFSLYIKLFLKCCIWTKWYPNWSDIWSRQMKTNTGLSVSKECYGRHLRKARPKLQP